MLRPRRARNLAYYCGQARAYFLPTLLDVSVAAADAAAIFRCQFAAMSLTCAAPLALHRSSDLAMHAPTIKLSWRSSNIVVSAACSHACRITANFLMAS